LAQKLSICLTGLEVGWEAPLEERVPVVSGSLPPFCGHSEGFAKWNVV